MIVAMIRRIGSLLNHACTIQLLISRISRELPGVLVTRKPGAEPGGTKAEGQDSRLGPVDALEQDQVAFAEPRLNRGFKAPTSRALPEVPRVTKKCRFLGTFAG